LIVSVYYLPIAETKFRHVRCISSFRKSKVFYPTLLNSLYKGIVGFERDREGQDESSPMVHRTHVRIDLIHGSVVIICRGVGGEATVYHGWAGFDHGAAVGHV